MSVDWSDIANTKFFKYTRGPIIPWCPFWLWIKTFSRIRHRGEGEELAGVFVEPAVNGVCDEFVEIFGEGSGVLRDGPFVVVQNEDEFSGRAGDVVKRLESNSASKGGISCNSDHMLVSSFEITGHASAQGCGQSGSGMSCSKGIVLAFISR